MLDRVGRHGGDFLGDSSRLFNLAPLAYTSIPYIRKHITSIQAIAGTTTKATGQAPPLRTQTRHHATSPTDRDIEAKAPRLPTCPLLDPTFLTSTYHAEVHIPLVAYAIAANGGL